MLCSTDCETLLPLDTVAMEDIATKPFLPLLSFFYMLVFLQWLPGENCTVVLLGQKEPSSFKPMLSDADLLKQWPVPQPY